MQNRTVPAAAPETTEYVDLGDEADAGVWDPALGVALVIQS